MIDIDNNNLFEMFKFPGGEWGVRYLPQPVNVVGPHYHSGLLYLKGNIDILARLNTGDDIIKLFTLTDAVRRVGGNINLYIPYFPGARQDRVANYGEPLTVKMYAKLINNQNYNSVTVLDPHSDVTPALLSNCSVRPVSHILRQVVTEGGYDTILIPDAGAAKKTFSYYFPDKELAAKLNFVQCLKKRDTATGKLSGFRIVDNIHRGANCLVVDDICDGGGTFIGLAEELTSHIQYDANLAGREPVPFKLGLYVTHGIFSQGLGGLQKYYKEIYSTNSIREIQLPGVKTFGV